MKRLLNKNNLYILAATFIFVLFFYISKSTPLAGDDWGYALNGMSGNPITMAIQFYNSWSGRFFSELWGFVVAPRKALWNVLNPLLFTLIFVFVYKLGTNNKNKILSILLIIAMMLSVDDYLRMETYSWIMGTTYVVPLLFSLIYFFVAKRMIFDGNNKKITVFNCLSNITLFVGGMMMENIAACMVGGITILIIYCWFANRKDLIKFLVINLVVALTAFVLMRVSPGSTYRLQRDNSDWLATPLFVRLADSYPNFLEKTFINNNYMILFLSINLILLSIRKIDIKNIVIVLINILAIFSVFSFVVIKGDNPFTIGSSVFSMIFWPVYIVNTFVCLFNIDNKQVRDLAIFVLIIGGANALAMLFSPIYGSRSSIYTVYYIIVLSVIVFNQIEVKKIEFIPLLLVLTLVIADRTYEYFTKYRSVANTYANRLQLLEYYRNHPEDEDVWLPRFGIYTIHSADVEIGDTYHFETFKAYYGLPQSADNIHFYYEVK